MNQIDPRDPYIPTFRESLIHLYRFLDRHGIKIIAWFAAICFLYAALCFTFVLWLVIASQ